jgi:hypothetical protein
MQTSTYALDTTWRTLLVDLGLSPANVLRRAGLPDDLLNQPSVRLEPEAYYRLWHSAEQEMGDPLFPIRVCEAVRSESFSPPLFAALCSPNLLVAGQRVAKYKTLIGPMRMDLREDRDSVAAILVWQEGPPPPTSLVMMELLFCVTLARTGTRENIRPMEVTTTELPSPLAPYEHFLGCSLRRGPHHAVRFAKSDTIRPFLTSNEPLWAAFEPDLRQRLANLDASVTVRISVN